MAPKLTVLVPSRGRPGNIRSLVSAWEATEATARLVVGVDADDPTLPGYEELPVEVFRTEPGSRPGMVAPLNQMAAAHADQADALGFLGDDCVPRTLHWDRLILDALDSPISMAYGNDLFQGANIPTAIVMSADIVRCLGFMALPSLAHICVDCVWLDLGRALNSITYLPEVILEHMHPAAGKASSDAQYDAVNHPTPFGVDRGIYERYRLDGLAADVERLRKVAINAK